MNPREQRGLELAKAANIRRTDRAWYVPASQDRHHYSVNLDSVPRCTCPDYELRGGKCKHICAVEYTLKRETAPDGTVTVGPRSTRPVPGAPSGTYPWRR